MSADLYIHILPSSLNEKDLERFKGVHSGGDTRWKELYTTIAETPSVWIGEVSWLKSWLFDDNATFVPDLVDRVQEIIGEGTIVLTEKVKDSLLSAFDLENTTSYDLARKEEVRAFLENFMEKKIFTISW